MATAQVDTRNLEWKDNNVGSKLLQKMGWKDGQSIGKRRLLNGKSSESSEGLRVKRRAEGLGLGATSTQQEQQAFSHATDFANVLKSLQEEHATPTSRSTSSKRKRKKSKTTTTSQVVMPTNKSTHAKVRQAKFQQKSEEDMKCIFAGADVFGSIAAAAGTSCASSNDKKRKRKESSDKAEKKSKKKDKSQKGEK